MKEKMLWSPSKQSAIRSSIVGGLRLTRSTSKEAFCRVYNQDLSQYFEFSFGVDKDEEVRKFMEEAALVIEQQDIEHSSNHKRLIRVEEDKK